MRFPSVRICLAVALVTAPPLSALQIGARLSGPRIKRIVITGPVQGGTTTTGVIELTAPAQPVTGKLSVPVALASSHPTIASVPARVLFRPRSTTQRFEVTTKPVAASTQVTITGRASIATTSAALVVTAPALESLECSPAELPPGAHLTCRACFNGPVPSGLTVEFKSTPTTTLSPSAASRPVPPNRCAEWSPLGGAIPLSLTTTVEATHGGVRKTAQTKVLARAFSKFEMDVATWANRPAKALITLTAPAPDGLVVTFAATPPLTVPSQVTIPTGQSTYAFNVGTAPVPSMTRGTVTVSTEFFGHKESKSAEIDLYPAFLQAIDITDAAALVNVPLGGRDVPATLRLNGPGGGMNVQFTSSNTRQATVTAAVTISGDATQAPFTIRVLPCAAASCTVNITAIGPPYGPQGNNVTKTLTLTRQ
jgi:hypothetical protein